MTMVTMPVYKKRRRTAKRAAGSESTPIDQATLIQDGFAQTSWIDFTPSRMVKILFMHNYAAKSEGCIEKSVKLSSVSIFLLR